MPGDDRRRRAARGRRPPGRSTSPGPAARSPTRAWRTDTSVTSYTVTAESPTSCWMTRQPTATSGSPAGASGMKRFPSAARSIADDATAPEPERTSRASRARPRGRTRSRRRRRRAPMTAGPRPSSSSHEQHPGAPKTPHIAASPSGPRRRPAAPGRGRTIRMPSRISPRTGSRSAAGGGGGSLCRIVPSSTRRDDEPDRVEGDRDRRGEHLDQEAADAEGAELRRRAGRRQGAVGRHQLVPLDDRGQVGVVGASKNVVSTAASAAREQLPASATPTNATGMEPSSTARPRSAQIRIGRRRRRSTHAPATRPTSRPR